MARDMAVTLSLASEIERALATQDQSPFFLGVKLREAWVLVLSLDPSHLTFLTPYFLHSKIRVEQMIAGNLLILSSKGF